MKRKSDASDSDVGVGKEPDERPDQRPVGEYFRLLGPRGGAEQLAHDVPGLAMFGANANEFAHMTAKALPEQAHSDSYTRVSHPTRVRDIDDGDARAVIVAHPSHDGQLWTD